ncbi:hypothetical protein Q3G72_019247 [Acer saccharum]|nr:hypothetical protein Q3G72_019247 [Acer saccharum]
MASTRSHRRSQKTRMRNDLKDFLKTPEEDWFNGKINRHDHFDDLEYVDTALNSVPEDLKIEDMHRQNNFSGGIVHRLLLRELHHDGPADEMRFLLGKHIVRFSKTEFCLITGLKFGVEPDTTRYEVVENGMHDRYFRGQEEVEIEKLRAVLRIGNFEQQYDAVKLALLFMLNRILMGFDGIDKVPVWQFRLVEDLDAFDVFLWGTHVYRRSIYGFKRAFDGPRQRLAEKRRQEGKDLDVQNLELTYNIYGLPHALLVFAFEVIPELGISKCGVRRTIELPPYMVAWPELVSTVAERAQRYIEGINLEANLYDSDHIPDPERHRLAGPNDMEGLFSRPSDTEAMFSRRDDREALYSEGTGMEGSELEGGNRRRQVRFTVPRQPRREGDVDLEARTESLRTRRQP